MPGLVTAGVGPGVRERPVDTTDADGEGPLYEPAIPPPRPYEHTVSFRKDLMIHFVENTMQNITTAFI